MSPTPMTQRSYNYSLFYRVVEWIWIIGYVLLWGSVATLVGRSLGQHGWHLLWLLTVLPIVGYAFSDFVTGFFHFLADNFGDERTPFFGHVFIRPFREHHVDPLAMTHHDFIERNAANTVPGMPFLIAAHWLPVEELWATALSIVTLSFLGTVVFANTFHRWAHMADPPSLVRKLQRWHLVLTRENHDRHHTPPFREHYCITVGWLNRPLDAIDFWGRLERFLRTTFSPPQEEREDAEDKPATSQP